MQAVGNAAKEDGKAFAKMADELAHSKAKAKQDAEAMDQLQAKLNDLQAAAAVKKKGDAAEGIINYTCFHISNIVEIGPACRSITL